MRLTALTLHGFKSFGNRTTIEFAPGVTAVVGPNGSGKSNIIDALKWASGGGRASEFRAGEKTELIFHGAAGKRSLGYAEVEVELRSDGRKLNIVRSLHRDGNGRLRLNGKNTRFMDIDEELAGSGLGKSGPAIIGQGEVSGVLMADPAKLLQYVAEVAGVARLAGRREQTEERLSAARIHLERLEDLMLELERQLSRLGAEAADARRHAELTRESLQLRFTLARLREASLRSEIAALREDQGSLKVELETGKSDLERLRGEVAQKRREQSEAEREYREAMARSEAKRGDVRVAKARVESLAGRRDDLERQLESIEGELAVLERLEEPQAPEGTDTEALARAEAGAAEALETAVAGRREAETQLQRAREVLDRLRGDAASAAEQGAALRSRRESLEQELEDLGRQWEQLESRAGLARQLEEKESSAGELRKQLALAEEQLNELRERLTQAQSAHATALAEAQARTRAAERSRQAFETRRGYAEGPRNALASGIEGIYGSVADLLRVPDEYREAVSAALGRRLEYVVVDSARTGQEVLDFVRRSGGFVTVLPLDLVSARPPSLSEAFRKEPGVVGLASELVEVDSRFERIAHQLLGNTTVVRSMPDAVGFARRERSRPRMVTLEGDTIESYGAMSGGRRHAQGGVLGAAAELEAAEVAAAESGEAAEEAEKELLELQGQARAAIEAESDIRRRLDDALKELAEAREAEAARRELTAEVERRRERAGSELERLEVPATEGVDPDELESAREAVHECEARLEEHRNAVEEGQSRLAESRQAGYVAEERLRAFTAAQEQYRRDLERREKLLERRGLLGAEVEACRREVSEAGEALAEAERQLPSDDLDGRKRALDAAALALTKAEEGHTQLAESQTSRAEALERINVTLARRESSWDAAAEELKTFPEGVIVIDGAERTLKSRLNDATQELEELGPVNHRAALEVEQEQARLDELREESGKAYEAIEELSSTLEQLDRETTTRLEAGVAQLREGFRRHVVELFGESAEGDIEVDRDEGRPVGLRIRLQPPGKQTRQLNLLSVGERTMGAMAFLFALMAEEDGQGMPIAILDEVDAPLDEANIRRYCDFLLRLAQRGTQFVLITHQKATFEVAEVIWGVTSEGGVSRVFSISRPEAVAVG